MIDLVFGEGMSAGWGTGKTVVRMDGRDIAADRWTRGLKRPSEGSVFYVPAHRALLLAEGWPAPFLKLNAETPVVARLFSQNLYRRFSGRGLAALFPVERWLKTEYRTLIDQAVFHGGTVRLEKAGHSSRLRLAYADGATLPYAVWTAGQREFTPLLLGLYHVLMPRGKTKRESVDWVVIEEPEMGLHPQVVAVVMLLVLDLLWRGYRVVMSTHSPLVLDVVWAIQQIRKHGGGRSHLCRAFGVDESQQVRKVVDSAFKRRYRVYYLGWQGKTRRVTSHDISSLDPGSLDEVEAYWGGLTRFSSRFGKAVRDAANGAE